MINFKKLEVWFITGSQHLYGEETLKTVSEHSQQIASFLNKAEQISVSVVFKPTVKTPEEIFSVCQEANASKNCIGIITWMHTFSPAKMWINGLKILQKPVLHLHTQFNRDIPWDSIDMDFMNLNQAAHGDREYGFINARLNKQNKVEKKYCLLENVTASGLVIIKFGLKAGDKIIISSVNNLKTGQTVKVAK